MAGQAGRIVDSKLIEVTIQLPGRLGTKEVGPETAAGRSEWSWDAASSR